MAYLPNTNVLRTRFVQRDGQWELIDFAPRLPKDWGEEAPIRLHRLLRPLGGRLRLIVDFDPRLNYGRGPTRTLVHTTAWRCRARAGRSSCRPTCP